VSVPSIPSLVVILDKLFESAPASNGVAQGPEGSFSPQVHGDLVQDGVCGLLLARKLKVSQLTRSEHMRVLSGANSVLLSHSWPIFRYRFSHRTAQYHGGHTVDSGDYTPMSTIW
jgi:hypothetical protein